MLQMRWTRPSKDDEVTPRGTIFGWPEQGRQYLVLQFREVFEVDEYGEVKAASEWQTVKEGA